MVARPDKAVERGEIWWFNPAAPHVPTPASLRPVLVVQADAANRSRIGTVLVAVITSNLAIAAAPGNVVLVKDDSGLPRDALINVSQLLTIEKRALTQKVGGLSSALQRQVDDGIRLLLAL